MNLVKSKFIILFLLISFLSIQSSFAQRGHHRGGHDGMKFSEALQNELNLSEEQKTQLKAVKADFKEKITELRTTESEDRTEKRAAMKDLMETQKVAIKNILTEEQLAVLAEKRTEGKGPRKEHLAKIDKEGLKAELAAYHKINISPTLLAQRAKLEASLSEADKSTIMELRMAHEAKQAARKEMKEARKQTGQKLSKEERSEKRRTMYNEEDRTSIKELVEKYNDPISALFTEIAPQKEKWKTDQRAILEKYRPEAHGDKQHRHHGHSRKRGHGHQKGQFMRKGTFLLLDPNQAMLTTKPEALTQIKIYPNPAVNSNTLDYTVKETGLIRIELHDAQGKLVRVLLNTPREAGTYQLQTNLSDLKNNVYYYRVSDKHGVTTKKFIITDK